MSVTADKSSPLQPGPDTEPVAGPAEGGGAVCESTVIRDPLVGQHIGEYVVRRRIGTGGMGVVYEGEHPIIGRKVAIKIIRPDGQDDMRARDLAVEARATSSIRHRGVIDIFGFGTLPGVGQYLVMEYLSGQPLDEVLLRRAPMPLPETLRRVIELLGALSAAHGMGVIHRDLKPGNIFLVRESNGTEYVKVLDFGLAKQAAVPHGSTPQTRANIVLGTPEYMAPEQACGQAVSPRTDLYAVGVILFELVTGRLPFQGNSSMHVAIQQVYSPPPAPSSLVEGLPPALDALILRLLAKAAEQRPASAEDVIRELEGIAATLGEQGASRPDPAAPDAGPERLVTAAEPRSLEERLPPARARVVMRPALGAALPSAQTHALALQTVPDAHRLGLATEPMAAVPRPRFLGRTLMGAGLVTLLVGGGVFVFLHSAPKEGPDTTQPVTPEAVSSESGIVQVSAKCSANLYIDGTLRAQAQLGSLPLSPGTHVLELKGNPAFEGYRTPFVIHPGQKTAVRVPCQRIK